MTLFNCFYLCIYCCLLTAQLALYYVPLMCQNVCSVNCDWHPMCISIFLTSMSLSSHQSSVSNTVGKENVYYWRPFIKMAFHRISVYGDVFHFMPNLSWLLNVFSPEIDIFCLSLSMGVNHQLVHSRRKLWIYFNQIFALRLSGTWYFG